MNVSKPAKLKELGPFLLYPGPGSRRRPTTIRHGDVISIDMRLGILQIKRGSRFLHFVSLDAPGGTDKLSMEHLSENNFSQIVFLLCAAFRLQSESSDDFSLTGYSYRFFDPEKNKDAAH